MQVLQGLRHRANPCEVGRHDRVKVNQVSNALESSPFGSGSISSSYGGYGG